MIRKTIWKFPLPAVSPVVIAMPKGAEVLTVQTQDGMPHVWAFVDPDAEREDRYFDIYGTGQFIHPGVDTKRTYIGTYQEPPFVWHLFERR